MLEATLLDRAKHPMPWMNAMRRGKKPGCFETVEQKTPDRKKPEP
jgi:hypothetical protein